MPMRSEQEIRDSLGAHERGLALFRRSQPDNGPIVQDVMVNMLRWVLNDEGEEGEGSATY